MAKKDKGTKVVRNKVVIRNDPNRGRERLPDAARGNPVYEQTREDMPLWCCGVNCGRDARIVALIIGCIGIAASIISIYSVRYFSFVAIRDDTFTDEDKMQPEPFEMARRADVGLFRYRISEYYRFPWPPPSEPPSAMPTMAPTTDNNGRRLQDYELEHIDRLLQDVVTTPAPTPTPPSVTANPTPAPTVSSAPSSSPKPTFRPTTSFPPTLFPTLNPTQPNPNDQIEDDRVGRTFPYEHRFEQFDQVFRNAQTAAVVAPVFAFIAVLFGMVELCCCIYRCSWLPVALFFFGAFFSQGVTLFIFLSEDFCKYAQNCRLGFGGFMAVLAVVCYMISNSLVCCAPRPPPCYDCLRTKETQIHRRRRPASFRSASEGDEDRRPEEPRDQRRRDRQRSQRDERSNRSSTGSDRRSYNEPSFAQESRSYEGEGSYEPESYTSYDDPERSYEGDTTQESSRRGGPRRPPPQGGRPPNRPNSRRQRRYDAELPEEDQGY